VRFVDGEEPDLTLLEKVDGGRDAEALGREVEKIQFTSPIRVFDATALFGGLGGVEELCTGAHGGQGIHLILHQSDQRGNDNAGALTNKCGNLVTQRLAATGRHEHKGITTLHDRLDNLALLPPERVVTERGLKNRLGRHHAEKSRRSHYHWHD